MATVTREREELIARLLGMADAHESMTGMAMRDDPIGDRAALRQAAAALALVEEVVIPRKKPLFMQSNSTEV